MATTPLTFTGVSTYSSDLQSILTRAQSIAELPVQALQQQQTNISEKQAALTGLDSTVASLASSIQNLGTIAANGALTATSSNPSAVQVTYTSGNTPGNYTISSIKQLASAASEVSNGGYADLTNAPVDTLGSGKVQLAYGTQTYNIDLGSNNNVQGLVNAINNLNVGVSASIINTGSATTPYYFKLSANAPGQTTLQLLDVPPSGSNSSPANLITNSNQGTDAQFYLSGIPTMIDKSSNSINDVIPGVTLTLQGTTDNSVQISLASDRSQLPTALNNFVQAYNSLVDSVDAQIGQGAGPLSGDFLISTLSDDLRQLSSYQSSGSVKSLSDLGITFDESGKMSFDSSALTGMSDAQFQDALKFLGSSSSGLAAFANTFSQISDSATGLIKQQEDSFTQQNTQLNDQISRLNDSITTMLNGEKQKVEQADALIANLQSEQNTVTSSVESLNYVLYGRTVSVTGQ